MRAAGRITLFVLLAGCAHAASGYRVPSDVGVLVTDPPAFAAFARDLRAGGERELPATSGEPRKEHLFTLALLDALDGHWPAAVARLDQIAALETSPAARAMRGLTIRIFAEGGDFRQAMEHQLAQLPIELVRDQLAMLRTMAQVFTPAVCRQLVVENVKARGGRVSFDDAQAIAFQRYAVVYLVPVAPVIDKVLAEHGIAAAAH